MAADERVPDRDLRFTLEISTVLRPSESPELAVAWVTDWLNNNSYDYREIGQREVNDRLTFIADLGTATDG